METYIIMLPAPIAQLAEYPLRETAGHDITKS